MITRKFLIKIFIEFQCIQFVAIFGSSNLIKITKILSIHLEVCLQSTPYSRGIYFSNTSNKIHPSSCIDFALFLACFGIRFPVVFLQILNNIIHSFLCCGYDYVSIMQYFKFIMTFN